MTAVIFTFPTRDCKKESYQFQPVVYWFGWMPLFTWQAIKTTKSLDKT